MVSTLSQLAHVCLLIHISLSSSSRRKPKSSKAFICSVVCVLWMLNGNLALFGTDRGLFTVLAAKSIEMHPNAGAGRNYLGFLEPLVRLRTHLYKQNKSFDNYFHKSKNFYPKVLSAPQEREDLLPLMGIPKFFRWLVGLYPDVKQDVTPSLRTINNFYVDMNGIIHLCTHGNQLIAASGTHESEMFQRIFSYLERLYEIVRPTKVMMLAVDGVAPRAKLNQQRNRRFRAAKLDGMRQSILGMGNETNSALDPFDPNSITPGTDFMFRLNLAMRKWVAFKLKVDPIWRNGCSIIFSGSDAPGEGEHKIMEFIRNSAKKSKGFKSESHCIYGLDADLMLLSLISHQPKFIVLREKLSWMFRNTSKSSSSPNEKGKRKLNTRSISLANFEYLDMSLFRKYLKHRFQYKTKDDEVIPYNVERIIDDFILISLLIGNDFLPTLPHLDISDGGMQRILDTYQMLLPKFNGYLTDKAKIHTQRLEILLKHIGKTEEDYFKQRGKFEEDAIYSTEQYKHHYYNQKFGWPSDIPAQIRRLVTHYIEGLYWILQYYHYGCSSWIWYYPYHYAPLCTDLHTIPLVNVTLEKGRPFLPLTQLLSVIPPQGHKLLPQAYRDLVQNEESPLVDLFPTDFTLDPNGKTAEWEYIVRIPFMNASRLLGAVEGIENKHKLEMKALLRNVMGRSHVMVPLKGASNETLLKAAQATSNTRTVARLKAMKRPHIKYVTRTPISRKRL